MKTTKQELQLLATRLNLPTTGTKQQLNSRIQEYVLSLDKNNKLNYILANSLNADQQKYCRCLLHVAAQQDERCLREKLWFQNVNGKQCYNPYAICSKSTKRKGNINCFDNYNLPFIKHYYPSEYNGLMHLHNK